MIPIGKVAMIETNKSDRTGACGRAGIRDVKTLRMLDATTWNSTPTGNTFVLDPLGCTNPTASPLGTTPLGGTVSGTASMTIQRINLKTSPSGVALTAAQAEDIFRWHDDLKYEMPIDMNPPQTGDRPLPVLDSSGNTQYDGHFSWFLTVTASPGEVQAGLTWAQRRQFSVSVVVCWNRLFTAAANDANAGETRVSVVCDNAIGYGGIGIQYDASKSTVMPKENEWVLLTSTNNGQASWYRVVSAGNDNNATNPTIRATLVGRDWYGGLGGTVGPPVVPDDTVKLIVVKGATGVYTTTVQLDDDGIWSK